MNGIINILKPPGMTSFDVVARVRGILRTKKVGHSGTLDPMAAGVLPVCVGNATKAIEYMIEKDKLYRAELTLGETTDTQDSSGEVLEKKAVTVSDNEIYDAVAAFKGKIKQLPPMYSAIKIDGKKLYELARKGVEIERRPRDIEVYDIKVINIKHGEKIKILFDAHCSKGTYIRTLCADIGERLGCGGHMSFLLRKQAGAFRLSTAVTLEELQDAAGKSNVESILQGVETIFDRLGYVKLNDIEAKKLQNGIQIDLKQDSEARYGMVKVLNKDGVFFALGETFEKEGRMLLRSQKFFI